MPKTQTELLYRKDGPPWLEEVAAKLGLETNRISLKTVPTAIHWHIRKAGSAGTLEATWWPSEGKFWIEQRANRTADWQEAVIADLLANSD